MDKLLHIQENDELLKFMLEQRFFKVWKLKDSKEPYNKTLMEETALELYLTANCNQKCEYCYLQKYKDGLYPREYDKKEKVLSNLKILLQWIIDNGYAIPKIELYSGEIWEYEYGREVLQILYDYVDKGLVVNHIMIPSNCSFLRNEEATGYIQRYINNFKKKGVRLSFSISVDGKIVEDISRPYNDGSGKEDDFYERMFLFAAHNEYYFHPMVAPVNIHKWIDNHKWWESECEKYDLNVDKNVMMLEVRDSNWSDEQIEHYNNFINYLIDRHFEKLSTKEEFIQELLGEVNCRSDRLGGYVPYLLVDVDTYAGCSVANTLTVRLGDLAICPCHRTAYNKYLYGKFVVENDKIVDIEANNSHMAIRILFGNNNLCHFGCDSCIFNAHCMKGCFGSQLETVQDPFMPISNVCKLFQSKIINILNKYEEYGIFDLLKEINPYSSAFIRAQNLIKFKKEVSNFVLGKNK